MITEICETCEKRVSVEFNGTELVTALVLKFPNINNYNDLLNKITEMIKNSEYYKSIIMFNNDDDFRKYVNDIGKKKLIIDNYILNLKNCDKNEDLNSDNIKCIFISGKINKHNEIELLNKGVSKLEAKSDIYLKLNNDKIIGLSIKQNKNATKSNYSVQKMLGIEENITLTNIKKQYLNEKGFTSFDKTQRANINELFYPQNKENLYFNKLREFISNKNKEISKQLVEPLYCSNIKYDMYEYDGTDVTKLNKVIDPSKIIFEEYLPYYFDKAGKERKAAKLFYRLVVEEKVYRVEIRWKGNVYNASPQFQIHEDEDVNTNFINSSLM